MSDSCQWSVPVRPVQQVFLPDSNADVLTGRSYCDFVIWGPCTFLVERVYADEDIWQNTADVAQSLHAKCVMPELCVKYFSKKYVLASNNNANRMCTVNVEQYCICRGVDDGSRMICCDNDHCATQWFHVKCLKMKRGTVVNVVNV